MQTVFFENLVRFCCRHAKSVLAASVIVALACGLYVARNFEMDSNSENLLSPDLSWRQHQAEFDAAFPQRNNLTLVVIDALTPERTLEAANALEKALAGRKDLFPVLRDIQGESFFAKNGLLYLPLDDLRSTTQKIISAQPFLGPLAADPSVRGIMDSLSAALTGVENGAGSLEDLSRPLSALSDTLEKTLSGRSAFLSWQSLIRGAQPSLRETRRLIEIQTTLDFSNLTPGGAASRELRKLAADLHLTPEEGVSVRLTGPVPLADEEFATLVDRAGLMVALMMTAILVTLWFAVRSMKIVAAILLTLIAGLALTAAVGLYAFGRFNVISVAFIPLFVGIGIDFSIQYCVRYRSERYRSRGLEDALIQAGRQIGPPLTLAAAATAVCFLSFVPTDYSGLAELGFIAGIGMIIAFLSSGTMLPALLSVLNPQGERTDVGFRWLAPLDAILTRRRRIVLISAGVLSVIAVSLLPFLTFNADPFDLRNQRTESMATLLDLMRDPETSPNTVDVLVSSPDAADALARRLASVSEVDRTLMLQSFIPDRQPEKLAVISDAALLMDTTLNPFEIKPAPTMAEEIRSIGATKEALRKLAGTRTTEAAQAARRLADALAALEKADSATFSRSIAALVPGLHTVLGQLRAAFSPQIVTLEMLPETLKREWLAADGRLRLQVFPSGNYNDSADLEKFAGAVRAIAPEATGAPISTRESGRTIVRAFLEAGILSFLAIAVLLAVFLRRLRDVVLTITPLLLTGVLTFATCVVGRLQLNFANIIVLPLLFGIGIAFNSYFIMSWRAGGDNFLQSSLSRAVIFSALTTASGFGTLWLSEHPGTATMGELLTISLAWTLVTTLFFLPALLQSARVR